MWMHEDEFRYSTPLTVQQVNDFLGKNRDRHLSNKVLHMHPSPALWTTDLDLDAIESNLAHRAQDETYVNMYMGIPFCLPTDPPHCGFCLFPTEKYEGKSSTSGYLDVMAQEAELYRDTYQGAKIESLYIGGGTPNLLQPADYAKLIRIAERLFPAMDDQIEKTLEGIPQLFSEDKIRAIKEAGFNRVSMGVQQLNEELIKYSGRKQTNQQVFDAIENFHKHGLSCNVDLIYGWPEQSIEDMIEGLRAVAESGIRHITHYELNIAGRSNFATKQKAAVPGIKQKYLMYREAKAFLMSQGFVQRTVYDWERRDDSTTVLGLNAAEYRYEQNLRDALADNGSPVRRYMGGIGYAAINVRANNGLSGDVPSISMMNHKGLAAYVDDVTAGRRPIERAYQHNREDIRLCWIFQCLQEMRLDMLRYRTLFGTSILDDYDTVFNAIHQEGWVEKRGHELVLVGEGEFYVPLIQSLISQSRVNEMTQPRKEFAIHPVSPRGCA
jgi:oxygen-independent coproporphyrinogen-3 oxidase